MSDGRLEVGRSGGEDFLEYLVRTFFQQTELVDVGLSRMLVLGIGWGAMLDSGLLRCRASAINDVIVPLFRGARALFPRLQR